MAITETQLVTWSHKGADATSRDTYGTVKRVLEDTTSPYYLKSFESFLQGSYGNDTNVWRDSDVDIVLRLDSVFYHDALTLPADQYQAFAKAYPGAAQYGLPEFKAEVAAWLSKHFNGVKASSKAIFIPASGNRRDCDVLICARFKYYYRFTNANDESYAEGICFFLKDGTRIVNFPKQHRENCTTKHQSTNQWFKPTVRVFKNMRNYLVDSKKLADGVAPSYYIEGMLWNVPAENFGSSHASTFVAVFNYLVNADRSTFKCANGIHPLFVDGAPTSWNASGCKTYLDAMRDLWNNWN